MIERDERGRLLPGNELWRLCDPLTRSDTRYKSPDALWERCLEYFQWVRENSLYEDKVMSCDGVPVHEPVAKQRAMTIEGLAVFLGVTRQTWMDWRNDRDDLKSVIAVAEEIIFENNFAGAAAGLLNHALIARQLGLADKQEITGRDGGPVQFEDVTADAEDFTRRIAGLAARGAEGEGTSEA